MAVQSHPVQYEGMRGDMKAALNNMYMSKDHRAKWQHKQIKHTYILEFVKIKCTHMFGAPNGVDAAVVSWRSAL